VAGLRVRERPAFAANLPEVCGLQSSEGTERSTASSRTSALEQDSSANRIPVQSRYDPLPTREAILWIVTASLAGWALILIVAIALV
jgi:hypothetical protein